MKKNKKLSLRMTLYCSVFAALLTLFIVILSGTTYYLNSLEYYKEYIRTTLKSSRLYLDGNELHEMSLTNAMNDYYLNIVNIYDEMIHASEIESIYVLVPDEKARYRYLFYGLNEEESERIEYDARNEAIEDEIEMNVIERYDKIIEGTINEAFAVNRFKNHYILSGGIPLYDSDSHVIGIIGIDVNMKEVVDDMILFIKMIVAGSVVIAAIFLLIFIKKIKKSIIKPVLHIGKTAADFIDKIMDKQLNEAYTEIKVNTRDEIESLADEMNSMMKEMIRYIGSIESYSMMQQKYDSQLKLAKQIQDSIIPNRFPAFPERKEFDIYAVLLPEKEVSREFYDFFMIDGTHLGIVIAEVSGEGVPAALFMMMTRTLIKNYSMLGLEPAKVLEDVNNELYMNNDACMTAGAIFGILDVYNGIFVYANAGEHSMIINEADKEIEVLKAEDGFKMGMLSNVPFLQEKYKLSMGGRIILYTGGILDIENYDLYMDVSEAFNRDESITEVLDSLRETVKVKMDENEVKKDITMVVVEYGKTLSDEGV